MDQSVATHFCSLKEAGKGYSNPCNFMHNDIIGYYGILGVPLLVSFAL